MKFGPFSVNKPKDVAIQAVPDSISCHSLVSLSYRFLTVPLSGVAWEECRGGRRQHQVASKASTSQEVLVVGVWGGLACLTQYNSEIHTHSVLHEDM